MKADVVFGLENATWPALLVNTGGAVMLTNSAAKSVFGAALAGNPPQLAAVWAAENSGTSADFLKSWLQSPVPVAVL